MHSAQTSSASFPTHTSVIPEFSLPSVRSFSCCLCSLSQACSKQRQLGERYLQKQTEAQLLLQMWAEGSGAPFIGTTQGPGILCSGKVSKDFFAVNHLQPAREMSQKYVEPLKYSRLTLI